MVLPCNDLNDILITPHRMGISALRKPNTVCFRGYERPLNDMLQSSSKIFRGAASDPFFILDECYTILLTLCVSVSTVIFVESSF